MEPSKRGSACAYWLRQDPGGAGSVSPGPSPHRRPPADLRAAIAHAGTRYLPNGSGPRASYLDCHAPNWRTAGRPVLHSWRHYRYYLRPSTERDALRPLWTVATP